VLDRADCDSIWSESESLIPAPQKPESESEPNSDSGAESTPVIFFLIPAKMLQIVFFVCQLSITLYLTYISVKLNEN
jgi:hypothetical protein